MLSLQGYPFRIRFDQQVDRDYWGRERVILRNYIIREFEILT
jgi:hypothetical protein